MSSQFLKPIETVYKGYRFRSRLEARWAVFFDTLGIKYEYEKEGYDLGGGIWYLPDFFLPDQNTFIEIKGVEPEGTELEKLAAFTKAINEHNEEVNKPFDESNEVYANAWRLQDEQINQARKKYFLRTEDIKKHGLFGNCKRDIYAPEFDAFCKSLPPLPETLPDPSKQNIRFYIFIGPPHVSKNECAIDFFWIKDRTKHPTAMMQCPRCLRLIEVDYDISTGSELVYINCEWCDMIDRDSEEKKTVNGLMTIFCKGSIVIPSRHFHSKFNLKNAQHEACSARF